MIRYKVTCLCVILLSICLDNKQRKSARMRLVSGWGEGTAVSIISILKGYFIHTLFIKCPITEQCLAVVWANQDDQLSINFLGYLLWTTTRKHIKLVQSGNESNKLSKKGLHISLHCILLRRTGTTIFSPQSIQSGSVWRWIRPNHEAHHWRILYCTVSLNHHVYLTAVLNETQETSNNCTCNAGKDFADSYQHILRNLPPYG